jgi:aryl-alcohol dehydrogenase-like predicted oxidoreductase
MAYVVRAYDIGVFPYSPLAGGFLTGKYRQAGPLPESARAQRIQERFFSDQNFRLLDTMDEIGWRRGQGSAQVALAWLLGNPLVTAPIVGANSVTHLRASLAGLAFRLEDQELQMLNECSAWQAA